MELLTKIAVLGLILGLLCWAFQPRYVFLVRIEDGKPHVLRGKVTPVFLGRVAEVCGQAGVRRGWVGGVPRGKGVVLSFSRTFPPGLQQQLRNQWGLHG